MVAPLVGVGVSGTILGYLFDPQRYLDLRDWAAIVAFATGLALIACGDVAPPPASIAAMVVLALGVYTVIAIGRAAVSDRVPRVPSRGGRPRARYHYIATIPIVVLLCDILQEAGRIGGLSAAARRLLLAAGLGLFVASYAGSRFPDRRPPGCARITSHRTARCRCIAAAPPGTTVYVENGPPHREIGFQLENKFPGTRAVVFLLLSPSGDLLNGRHVPFIERDPEI